MDEKELDQEQEREFKPGDLVVSLTTSIKYRYIGQTADGRHVVEDSYGCPLGLEHRTLLKSFKDPWVGRVYNSPIGQAEVIAEFGPDVWLNVFKSDFKSDYRITLQKELLNIRGRRS